MNIIIVGAGTVGYYLALSLLGDKHDIKLIDRSQHRCTLAADKLDATVIHGDGTEISVLKKAHAQKADILVAVTGKDEDNFVCGQIAKQYFKIQTTIVRANNPQNIEAMKQVAADIVISSANIISQLIEQEVDSVSMRIITRLTLGDSAIMEFIVNEQDPIQGKSLQEIELPDNTLVITIVRNGKSIIPRGDTMLLTGDNVMVATKEENKKRLQKLFNKSFRH